MTYDSSDPATIERELAETRARLDTHLDAISNRLSPGRLIDEGLDYLRHGPGAEFVRNLDGQLRENPMPVALTGIGLAWLMASTSMGKSKSGGTNGHMRDTFDDVGARARLAGASLTRLTDESEDAFNARVAAARGRVLGLQQEAAETASAFVGRVQQALDAAQQAARERLAQTGEAASEWGATVTDRARRTGEAMGNAAQQGRDMMAQAGTAIAETVNQNPMLLGALGLVGGVLLAALLPVTQQEEALAAPVGRAVRDVANEAVERGGRAAEAAAEAAYHEVAEP